MDEWWEVVDEWWMSGGESPVFFAETVKLFCVFRRFSAFYGFPQRGPSAQTLGPGLNRKTLPHFQTFFNVLVCNEVPNAARIQLFNAFKPDFAPVYCI